MGKLSRVQLCPRVAMKMECPDCGYSYAQADRTLDPEVPHISPFLEIGPKKGPFFRISLLWIDYKSGTE